MQVESCLVRKSHLMLLVFEGLSGLRVDIRSPEESDILKNVGHTTLALVLIDLLLPLPYYSDAFVLEGLPSAALCTWGSGLANAAVFALIFPAVGRLCYILHNCFLMFMAWVVHNNGNALPPFAI